MADRIHISGSQSARRPSQIEREDRQRHRRSLSFSHDRLRHSQNSSFNSPISSYNHHNYPATPDASLINHQSPPTNGDDSENDITRKKTQFFNAHKSEEWLRNFYHPLRETCKQMGKDMLESAVHKMFDSYFVEKRSSEKHEWIYQCKAPDCKKAFKERKFLHKHLMERHSEISTDVREHASEEVYFQHYMNDPNGPYPQQVNNSTRLPPVVVPIQGSGPHGPFVAAPVEVTWEVISTETLEYPRRRETRTLIKYDDLQRATEDEVTVTDYRYIDY